MHVNIVYKSIKSIFNYILTIIQVIEYRIDEGNVIDSSDVVRPFLGNRTWLGYFLNNILTLGYFFRET
jgi:hypothetical protein